MGKRKYEKEPADSAKRNKLQEDNNEISENVSETDQPQNVENIVSKTKSVLKNASFDIKHFRKELAAKQGQTMVLTQFLQVCLNPDNEVDYMLEYLKVGGNSHEILRQITQDNKKNLTLATPAFHLFHLIIVKVQSSLPHMISITEEACRYFLNTFIPTVEIMISENSGPRHRKIILNLLTSMVTLNSDLGVEVLNQVPLTPKHLQYIVEKPNYKEKDNVRTAFVHFMTSFLVDGHLPLIKALLEKQGLLPLIIPGLVQDEPEAVFMFLNILKKNVIDNNLISKTLKLKTFSHQVLHNMFKVFMWKGPPEMNVDLRNESRPEIMALLSDIMLTLFTSHRLGIYFVDKALGTSDLNKNQNLYKALLSLKRPWENEHQCNLILQVIYKCPDLHRAIINIVEQSFQPLHSPIWEKATEFVIKLLDKMRPEDMIRKFSNLSSIQVTNFIRFVTLPVPLLKHIQANIGKDQTVSLYCVKVLAKMLQTLKRYMQILESEGCNENVTEVNNKLDNFLPKHLPPPNAIVALIQDVIKGDDKTETGQDYRLPKLDATQSLLSLLDLLLLYNYTHPAYFESLEGNIDMKKILDFSMTLTDGQIPLLKFKIVSLWLMLDNTIMSLKNPMFKDLFQILLEVYTSENDNTWFEAKDTLVIFFKSTGIFEADEDEIQLMLYTLRHAKIDPVSLVGDTVEYALANSKELAEYVRNQIINFEVSDESSSDNLDKLFNDLMSNRCTGDSVFLESKIPSSFIVGCMQFILNQREKKKHLKNFLSLYVVNLLHYNYSPELTEVLIGDCKLDARSYVVDWASKPVAVPENFGNDIVLKNLSNSLLSTEIEQLQDIFPFLEATSDENDFVMDLAYKISGSKTVDSAELFVWAKYLMFSVIRLANMNQLTELHMQKVTMYFECIIALGRKCHMIHVCRNIILNVLKNSHFLKIYTPLDMNKSASHIVATKFILNIITKHADIVDFTNHRHFVLKSYQQKNYSEIMKAFVKINKRKNINSEHTVNVLRIVGLSSEDDILVLNQIFDTKIESCIKDDKEPSLVLELLRLLIEKYSKTITSDLPQELLKKSMSLYNELLTNKEVVPNLTSLEMAFIQYFENKPHQALHISKDDFKCFFLANTIRKTTSQLASILLRNNVKFCHIFKEEICRPEILGQRELTLPLGVVIIEHGNYLRENKVFLPIVYNEYKSNILKFLEKPHKAGQIYISCWKFIRKLIIECMDIEDCKKLFAKSHKFEVSESSHVQLLQAVFLKMCVLGEGLKNEHLILYFMNLLQITTIAIKENKEDKLIEDIIAHIYKIAQICKHVVGFNLEQKEEFAKFTESSVWQNFCKVVLKDSLKVRTMEHKNSTGPKLLCLLSTLVKLFYPDDSEDIVTLFDMVTSHSEFLNVMLSYHSPDVKSRLLEFLFVLISKNKSVMKAQQIPVYLSAYHATRNPSDRMITRILHFYESNGQPVNEYKPYVWGDSAANYYSVRKNRTSSLWGHPTPNQVMNLFERDLIEMTVRHFPVNQKVDYDYELSCNLDLTTGDGLVKIILDSIEESRKHDAITDTEGIIQGLELKVKHGNAMEELKDVDLQGLSHLDTDEAIYEPLFLFPLLSHLLAPGSVASCFKMLRTGLLSIPVMALSSHCPRMRASAFHVLHRFCLLLETETRHKSDKLLLTDFITTLRQSLPTAIEMPNGEALRNPRLPAVGALYLAKALMVSTSPSDPLYKPVNNFLIAKQFVDLTVVPDFLSLFHDSDVEFAERRLWILDIIRDGTKTMTDVNVIFKTMCLKMIMDYHSTVISDRKTKEKIIVALNSIITIPRAFEILVEGYGFLAWLHGVVRHVGKDDKNIVRKMFVLLRNMIVSMDLNLFGKHYAKLNLNSGKYVDVFADIKFKSDIEYEILNIAYNLLPHTQDLEIEDVTSYIEIYRLITKRSLKFMTKKQMLNIISKCSNHLKNCESVRIITQSVVANNAVMLNSKNIDESDSNDAFIRELRTLAHTYLV
ncbi:nucleolar pre-ribosomal-associated protein 1 [Epargyreus clarus]|uniref:nucleolar pre-ribosomal-associated protein 1 n=1 Tax=Epargyreus clarus TaxID=520877 RepID=UPI003C2B2A69